MTDRDRELVTDAVINGPKTWFDHGSRTVRADFHLHTKADKEFTYKDNEREFCRKYVDRLVAEGVSVGVITNHNKFDYGEFKALRKAAAKEEIVLLPGVELSIDDGSNGVHALIVFSNEWLENGADHINSTLSALFKGEAPQNFQNRNMRTSYGLLDTISLLEGRGRDFFLVFAHVEQNNGLWKEVSGGRFQGFGQDSAFRRRTLGFQKVRENNEEGRNKVKVWLDDWYPAEVEGSDCKSLEEIGKGKHCYLKLGELTYEAVKYALSDHSVRVYREREEAKHSHVLSATFKGGVLDGKTIKFSPHLNTLIGVRGSGKSSVLECVRYGLDVLFGNEASDNVYKENLVAHIMGSGGQITLHVQDDRGQEFEVKRIYGRPPTVHKNGVEHTNVSISETVLRNPIYFGQKDLADNGSGFEKDLVEKFIWKNLKDIWDRVDSQCEIVRRSVQNLNKISDTEERRRDLELQKGNAEHKLKFYEQNGVKEKLQKQVEFDRDERHCQRLQEHTKVYLNRIETLVNDYEGAFDEPLSYESGQNADFFAEVFGVFRENIDSHEELRSVRARVEDTLKRLQGKTGKLKEMKANLEEDFARISRKMVEELQESESGKFSTDEYRELCGTVEETADALKNLSREESRKGSLLEDLRRELATLEELRKEEYQRIQTELEKVNDKHSSLKISVDYKADKEAYLDRLKEACKGSRIHEATLQPLVKKFSDFGDLYVRLDDAKDLVGNSANRFEDYLTRELNDLLTWQVPHKFTIEYQGRELRYHSLGQRASALMIFVLNQQDNDLIIIDQPEDDLDSHTIYEDVVKLVRRLKMRVQFIFATHNANFPVLGDAEQVSACEYSDHKISVTSGSIDSQCLQNHVVDIMEGGSEAFRQRKKIYEMWGE